MNRYILVGAGGTGSFLADPLNRYLRAKYKNGYQLVIVDGDEVEAKNISRQAFTYEDIHGFKATMLAERLEPKATPGTQFITPENVDSCITNGDTVLIATDNYYVRRVIDEHVTTLRDVTVINGGNGPWTSTVQVHVRRGRENLTPRISFMHPEIASSEPVELGPSCAVRAEQGEEQTIGANLMSAAWMLIALQVIEHKLYNSGDLNYLPWHEIHVDPCAGIAGGPDWRLDGPDTWHNELQLATA